MKMRSAILLISVFAATWADISPDAENAADYGYIYNKPSTRFELSSEQSNNIHGGSEIGSSSEEVVAEGYTYDVPVIEFNEGSANSGSGVVVGEEKGYDYPIPSIAFAEESSGEKQDGKITGTKSNITTDGYKYKKPIVPFPSEDK